jgi:hypothetical protein
VVDDGKGAAAAAPNAVTEEVAAAEALTSGVLLLLADPAEMSLAGPVADASDIFSSSNSAGPVKK